MSNLIEAFEKYVNLSKTKSTFVGFLNEDENNPKLVQTWISSYTNYNDAKNGVKRTFVSSYKAKYPNTRRKFTKDIDISVLFERAQTVKTVSKESAKLLATNVINIAEEMRTNLVHSESATESSTSTKSAPPVYYLKNNVEVLAPLRKYIATCQRKSKETGFFLNAELQELLASQSIILLKKNEADPVLLESLSPSDIKILKGELLDKYIDRTTKVDDDIYKELCLILRNINEKASRRAMKEKIMSLYPNASYDDTKILDVFLNCLNKLPNFTKTDEISEMELTTNFIDPVVSPLFHHPGQDKQFIWLNKKDENTIASHLDGVMRYYTQKCQSVALGYCEVKLSDAGSNQDLLWKDLFRLGEFSKNLLSRKENNIACCLQAVGQHCSFYLTSLISTNIIVMNEIMEFDVPMEIKQLNGLLNNIDQLKQLLLVYENYCQISYNTNIEQTNNIETQSIKPKKRKRSTDKTTITFN